ncbi:MAG: cytochrome oxidase [bacterium]
MEVIVLLVFVSLTLVAGAILLLLSRVHAGDLDHGDRLSLLPLENDETAPSPASRISDLPGESPGEGR